MDDITYTKGIYTATASIREVAKRHVAGRGHPLPRRRRSNRRSGDHALRSRSHFVDAGRSARGSQGARPPHPRGNRTLGSPAPRPSHCATLNPTGWRRSWLNSSSSTACMRFTSAHSNSTAPAGTRNTKSGIAKKRCKSWTTVGGDNGYARRGRSGRRSASASRRRHRTRRRHSEAAGISVAPQRVPSSARRARQSNACRHATRARAGPRARGRRTALSAPAQHGRKSASASRRRATLCAFSSPRTRDGY